MKNMKKNTNRYDEKNKIYITVIKPLLKHNKSELIKRNGEIIVQPKP